MKTIEIRTEGEPLDQRISEKFVESLRNGTRVELSIGGLDLGGIVTDIDVSRSRPEDGPWETWVMRVLLK